MKRKYKVLDLLYEKYSTGEPRGPWIALVEGTYTEWSWKSFRFKTWTRQFKVVSEYGIIWYYIEEDGRVSDKVYSLSELSDHLQDVVKCKEKFWRINHLKVENNKLYLQKEQDNNESN